MSKGVIFRYVDKAGETVKGVALNDEQSLAFLDHGKAFLRILNDDLTFKTTDEGKRIIAVKDFSCLVQIGFWN